jgi:hypothetical protein
MLSIVKIKKSDQRYGAEIYFGCRSEADLKTGDISNFPLGGY